MVSRLGLEVNEDYSGSFLIRYCALILADFYSKRSEVYFATIDNAIFTKWYFFRGAKSQELVEKH